MNFKSLSRFCLTTAVAIIAMACNDIDERYIKIEQTVLEPEKVYRAVLIEDFTGQSCKNCPTAHEIMEKLVEQYGAETVIPVSIHAGSFSYHEDYLNLGRYDLFFGTDEGEEYAKYWGIDAYPSGLVDRLDGIKNYDDWASAVRTAVTLEAPASISLDFETSIDENTNATEVTIKTSISPTQDIECKYQLWVVESGLVSLQILSDGSTNAEYVHNNVFRGTVNGLWGEDVTLKVEAFEGVVNEGEEAPLVQPLELTHTLTLRELWNIENLSIVAFLYNESDGVLQVTSAPIISE